MFKVINLDNLANMKDVYKEFATEEEAQQLITSLANHYSKSGYQVQHIPASEGILFNDPQMLKVIKCFNVTNPNAPENIIVYALVPHNDNELVTVTRNRMKYFSEAEDETNYNFVNRSEGVHAIHEEMLANDYILVNNENGMYCYKSETDTFISEVYVL